MRYITHSGIQVSRTESKIPYHRGLKHLLRKLDTNRGIYLSSGYEYPERYSRWDIAAICPPLEMVAFGRDVWFRPLNARGKVLTQILSPLIENHPHWDAFENSEGVLHGHLKPLPKLFPEEERSKQPSAFSILRLCSTTFGMPAIPRLALAGAFGYDLLFQFDPIDLEAAAPGDARISTCFYATTSTSWIARRNRSSVSVTISNATA